MNDINKILTFGEATELWGLADSTLRKLAKADRIKEGIDYRKSGKRAWLITREVMERLYGKISDNSMDHVVRVKNIESGYKYNITGNEYENDFSFDTRLTFEDISAIEIRGEYMTIYIPTEEKVKIYDAEKDEYVLVETYKEVTYKKEFDTWHKY